MDVDAVQEHDFSSTNADGTLLIWKEHVNTISGAVIYVARAMSYFLMRSKNCRVVLIPLWVKYGQLGYFFYYIFNPTFGFVHIWPKVGLKQPSNGVGCARNLSPSV